MLFKLKWLETGEQQQRATTVQRSINKKKFKKRKERGVGESSSTEPKQLKAKANSLRGGWREGRQKKKHNSERKKATNLADSWRHVTASVFVCRGVCEECVCVWGGGGGYSISNTAGPQMGRVQNALIIPLSCSPWQQAYQRRRRPLDAATRGSDDITRQKGSPRSSPAEEVWTAGEDAVVR